MAYLTHCNSPQHNRKLGMNMKVKSVSAAAIAEKLSNLRNEATKFARVRE